MASRAASGRKHKVMGRPSGFSDDAATNLHDDRGMIAIDALAERLHLTRQQFAETAGISRDTIYKPARLASPKTQGRLREVAEILDRVRDWAGGDLAALAWYRSRPIPALGGRTAEALVKDGRATLVRDWLDAVAVGTFH
jgi:uncharacterized protein (DUF2384 family)